MALQRRLPRALSRRVRDEIREIHVDDLPRRYAISKRAKKCQCYTKQ